MITKTVVLHDTTFHGGKLVKHEDTANGISVGLRTALRSVHCLLQKYKVTSTVF